MKNALKFLKLNRNFIILGVLLVALPVLLVLSQTQQIFQSQAGPNDPAVTGITPFNTSATGYTTGQLITTTVALNSFARHFDAYYIDADANPNPNFTTASIPIPELTGRPAGSYPWVVPNTAGHYFFVVNAHSRVDDGIDDWNQSATPPDTGCAWDTKIYRGPPPLQATADSCTNVGKKEFWVGTVTPSPSPSPSASVAVVAPPSVPASPVSSRLPRASTFIPDELAATCIQTDFECLAKDPIQFTGALYSIGLGVVGGVGILFMVIGAYMVLASQGDAAKVAKGKEFITYSIIGILLALFGYAFYQIIAVDILELPGFSK